MFGLRWKGRYPVVLRYTYRIKCYFITSTLSLLKHCYEFNFIAFILISWRSRVGCAFVLVFFEFANSVILCACDRIY